MSVPSRVVTLARSEIGRLTFVSMLEYTRVRTETIAGLVFFLLSVYPSPS